MMVLSDFNYDTDYCYRWLTFLFSEEVKLRYREYKVHKQQDRKSVV